MAEPIEVHPSAEPLQAAPLPHPAPCALVLFGAGGEQTKRLVVPAH
jgi:hypothetical protein